MYQIGREARCTSLPPHFKYYRKDVLALLYNSSQNDTMSVDQIALASFLFLPLKEDGFHERTRITLTLPLLLGSHWFCLSGVDNQACKPKLTQSPDNASSLLGHLRDSSAPPHHSSYKKRGMCLGEVHRMKQLAKITIVMLLVPSLPYHSFKI